MNRLGWIFVGVFVFVTVAPSVAQEEPFKLLATNRTGTMEEELNEAGAAGYRVVGMQGGETGVRRQSGRRDNGARPRGPAIPLRPAGDEPHRHIGRGSSTSCRRGSASSA